MLIGIIIAAGVAGIAAAAGALGGRREPEPAVIPARVEPRRRRQR